MALSLWAGIGMSICSVDNIPSPLKKTNYVKNLVISKQCDVYWCSWYEKCKFFYTHSVQMLLNHIHSRCLFLQVDSVCFFFIALLQHKNVFLRLKGKKNGSQETAFNILIYFRYLIYLIACKILPTPQFEQEIFRKNILVCFG